MQGGMLTQGRSLALQSQQLRWLSDLGLRLQILRGESESSTDAMDYDARALQLELQDKVGCLLADIQPQGPVEDSSS